MSTSVHAFVVLVVLFLGVSVSAQGTTASPVQDAQGDAEDIFGQGPPLHDLDVISVTIMGPALAVEVSFFTAIAPPSAQGFLSVLALVEFDTDQDDSTGEAPIQNDFPPLTVLSIGVDYIANIVSEFDHPGLIDIQDAATGALVALSNEEQGIYNLHHKNLRIADLAERVAQHFPGLVIEQTPMKFQDTRNYRVSSEKAKKLLGLTPCISVDEGIRELKTILDDRRIKDLDNIRYINHSFLAEHRTHV